MLRALAGAEMGLKHCLVGLWQQLRVCRHF